MITKFVDCKGLSSSMHSAASAVLLALGLWISPINAYTYAVIALCLRLRRRSKLHRYRIHAMNCLQARQAVHKTAYAFSVDSRSGLQQLNYTSSPSQGFVGSFAGPLYSAGTAAPSCSVLISPGLGTEVNTHQHRLQQKAVCSLFRSC